MGSPAQPQTVIVTPVYEDAEACQCLLQALARENASFFVVIVDDGSASEVVTPSQLTNAGLDGVVIRLRRNLGHQRALAVGVNYVAEHMPNATCVLMDSDGEDVPASINELLEPLSSPDTDIVVATRKKRVETIRFRLFYVFYKALFSLLSGRRISFGNFMALNPVAVRRLAAMQELWIHVAATALVSKLRISNKPLDRGARYAGRSRMNFGGLVLHGFRALMVVAEDVLVRVGIGCILLATATLIAVVASFALKLMGISTPGWFSTALGILLLVMLQTATLTLITLMLTGVVRGNLVPPNYRTFVDNILIADDKGQR